MKHYLFLMIFIFLFYSNASAQDVALLANSNVILNIVPSKTDARINTANTPHFVTYNPTIKQGKLLLFLPGTNGIASKGPKDLFSTAIDQGYYVINLSYINTPAIAQICKGNTIVENSNCAEDFRNRRVYGTTPFSLISDAPYDAIVNRLTKLLIYLSETNVEGNWGRYLENGQPKWEEIALAGQSQGGGMSAFIAKTHRVARVIDFSGGWDYSAKNKIADWYFNDSKTPLDRWYGTYHVKEPAASTIIKTYKAMNIPENNIYAFDLEVPEGKKAHSNGIRNLAYKEQWVALLGKGN
ncbi:BPSS1187 family protein [Cellulophaga sp. Z1A5H]|uniref:BPSS1187 family protein n=1 Tax=Cellulophaga sp. Z1A5H TaxID=2687291 RepID=UPI0013FD6D81|nr:VanZ family protein [Cellulophaga sp. Z1A5H]